MPRDAKRIEPKFSKPKGAMTPKQRKAFRSAMEARIKASVKAMAKQHAEERRRTRGIDEETRSVGFGPVELNVEMARLHGWSEEGIRRAYDVLQACARKESIYARRAHPYKYFTAPDGTVIFVGDFTPAARRRIERVYARPARKARRR